MYLYNIIKSCFGRLTVQTSVRPPAVAGMFYPDDPLTLGEQVDGFLNDASASADPTVRAIIAPHAGYIYSGQVAATAYACLGDIRQRIHRVLLLGPSHRVGFHGLALPSHDYFASPLGQVPVDRQALAAVADLPGVQTRDDAHAREHGLEVHLPFLQRLLDDFTLVPVVVGEADGATVAALLDALWRDDGTLVVISSDLSHFHDYQTACQRDAATSQAITELRAEDIGYGDACGRNPINGLLHLARQRGLRAECLDLRNSGDTAGPRDQVVGYGAYAFHG